VTRPSGPVAESGAGSRGLATHPAVLATVIVALGAVALSITATSSVVLVACLALGVSAGYALAGSV
jgi:hypothetical protein